MIKSISSLFEFFWSTILELLNDLIKIKKKKKRFISFYLFYFINFFRLNEFEYKSQTFAFFFLNCANIRNHITIIIW